MNSGPIHWHDKPRSAHSKEMTRTVGWNKQAIPDIKDRRLFLLDSMKPISRTPGHLYKPISEAEEFKKSLDRRISV